MKKFFITLVLLVGAVCQAAAAPAGGETLEYKYFFFPLAHLWEQDPQMQPALLAATRPLTEDFDYTSLFGDAQVILLGEIHDKEVISREINVILKQSAGKPSMGITHLATEFLLQSAQPNFDKIKNKNIYLDRLSQAIDDRVVAYNSSLLTMQMAENLGLKVVGLDVDKILTPGGTAWALSPEGLKTRNQAWLKKIMEVIKQNPRARVVVHCGALHSQYVANSLSTLLKRKGIKTHVVLFEVGPDPKADKHMTCQFFRSLNTPPVYVWYRFFCLFGKERDNLLIQVPPQYRDVLGADTVVYFGNPNPMSKMTPQAKADVFKDMQHFPQTACHLHPDSVACQKLRHWSFVK